MMTRNISVVGGAVLLLALGAASLRGAADDDPPSDLVVHEWGTFLAMQGSDGATLDGMYHEEHALPAFVHSRGKDQLRLPSMRMKGETPVIYFYTNHRQRVAVRVDFPSGIWTQWYPQASLAGPPLTQLGTPPRLRGGFLEWAGTVIPPTTESNGATAPELPKAAPGALWDFARDVDAAYFRTANGATPKGRTENERFIFYRGLGTAELPIEWSPADGGTLRVKSSDESLLLLKVFVIRVENGRGTYKHFESLNAGRTETHLLPDIADALPLDEFTDKIATDLAGRLTGVGLYPKEARAMVNTWRTSYFQTDGIRVLFVLPQKWTDEFIPMTVSPRPKDITRVMVGRLEVLSPERERQAKQAVADLASDDADTREAAFAWLRDQGRYVEPIVRQVERTSDDARVRALCRRLLLTDFVTDLRTAANSATTGVRLREDPLFVRAQLASLLREVGLDKEAKAEAKRVTRELDAIRRESPEFGLTAIELTEGRMWQGLVTKRNYEGIVLRDVTGGTTRIAADEIVATAKVPDSRNDSARHYLRAYARATEGAGDDAGAAEWYGKFIRFASQVGSEQICTACHDGVSAPRDLAWFSDWWAGRRYAEAVGRLDKTIESIAQHERRLASAMNDTAARMSLAYLYESSGRTEKARELWAKLTAPSRATETAAGGE